MRRGAGAVPGLFSREEGAGVATAVSLLAATSMPVILLGAVAVQVQAALGFGDQALGLGVGLFWAVSALSAPWGGRLADRRGWPKTAAVAGLLASLPLLGIGIVVTEYRHLLVLLVAGGLAHGVGSPAGNVALSAVRPRRRGLAFGMKQASVPLASTLAGLAVPVVALTVGWRWAFVLALPLPAAAILAARTGRVAPRTSGASASRVGASSRLWLEAAAGALGTLSSGAMATFTVRSLTESGIGPGTSGIVFAVGGALSMGMRLGGGWWADRGGSHDVIRQVMALLLAGAIGMGLIATGRPALAVVGALLALGLGWSWVGVFLVGAVSRDEASAGTTTGALQLGLAGGAAGGPVIFGFLLSVGGFALAWTAIAVCTAMSALLLGRLDHHRRHQRTPDRVDPAGQPDVR